MGDRELDRLWRISWQVWEVDECASGQVAQCTHAGACHCASNEWHRQQLETEMHRHRWRTAKSCSDGGGAGESERTDDSSKALAAASVACAEVCKNAEFQL
eukprot:scaffold45980_cov33-Tisochrysis_lutea.AAC.1